MKRLSTALSTELSEDRLAVYWDALCDLSIDGVTFACQHAARYWRPSQEERRFPFPATLRDYTKLYREQQVFQAAEQARQLLPTWSESPDEAGMQAIRKVLDMLGDGMDMKHPVYQEPSTDDPEKRRAELMAQARQITTQTEGKE